MLDIYLPGREDGWQLLPSLKMPGSTLRLIPVTLLSHSEMPEDIQIGYDLGANSYLVKPTDYAQWLDYFQILRQYWWNTVSLPLANRA